MSTSNPQIVEPAYTPEVARETEPLRQRLQSVIPDVEWAVHAPYIAAINKLKREMNAVLLVHNYQTPEIYHGVADFVGDSLALARKATEVDADIIVQCGVHFMAETTKLLNPEKTVLIPDLRAGCSLAASITAADVRQMRADNPGVPVVSYVNTTAEVKAETDVCCTSANAVQVVESLGVDKVIFTPDGYLARYVQSKTDVEIIFWEGACEVHERFTAEDVAWSINAMYRMFSSLIWIMNKSSNGLLWLFGQRDLAGSHSGHFSMSEEESRTMFTPQLTDSIFHLHCHLVVFI